MPVKSANLKPSRSPRVMHIISSLGIGGAERLLLDFMRSMEPHDSERFSVVIMNEADQTLLAGLRTTRARVVWFERPRGSKNPSYAFWLLREFIRNRTEVIHAHNPGSKIWACVLKVLVPGTRVVFTVHNTTTVDTYSAMHKWLHNWLVDSTICISKSVEQTCRENGLRNLCLIPNGVDLTRFSTASEPDKCRLEAQPDRVPIIVNVARFAHRNKGQDVLIRACQILKEQGLAFKLRLVGAVSPEEPTSLQQLKEIVQATGLEAHTEFICDVADAADYTRDGDVFALSSYREGFGLVVLEAMAAGVPVVVSDIEGPREFVEHGVSGMRATPGDATSFAKGIEFLLRNPAQASEIARNGRRVAAHYAIETLRDRYLSLYVKLTTRQP